MTTPINGATATSGTSNTSSASASNPLASLQNPNTFLNLLVAQLKYQDPLNPTSGTQFLSQTAQLTEVETMTQLQQSQQTLASTSMIGKSISATLSDGTTISGLVDGVALSTSGGPTLSVNGTSVPLSDVQTVGTAPATTTGSGSSS